ncbi:MAG: Ldh family oxidoreductase [Candidatus Woesearchaeota archaeon]|nr:MAG: Ldh family oxidoreductase [Candidatus Woesearchaeota archaeon]
MELAIKKAKSKGIALVGIHNMHSYLMPGYYAKMAADKNMIGFVIDNARSRVAPYGGIEPRLGANPIGLAIPAKDIPFVLDMATAKRGMGEVRLAKKLGEELPEEMALDIKGNPTRDPNKVNALKPAGEYKGYGLCLAIEILAGAFIRAKMGSRIKDGLDRGYLFLVIDPKIFVDVNTFKKEVSDLFEEVKSAKKAEGFDEILIPGEHAKRLMDENLKKGYLEVDDKIIKEIRSLI